MIPISLTLQGFLSYKEPVTIDFSGVDVACISGANGSGKSSLFDAITWVLFGRARRSDDALINDAAESCRVEFEFDYENDRYRVQREKPRGKATLLELQIRFENGCWKTLTEAGVRMTEDRIREVLRLDYDTFINASFFLQGKADMFTQQAPARRKEILSTILGLEIWEAYKEEAAGRRKNAAIEVKNKRAWLDEVIAELDEEAARTEKLKLLLLSLEKTSARRAEVENRWNSARQIDHELRLESEKLAILERQIESARARLSAAQEGITARSGEKAAHEELIGRADQIEKAHLAWQNLRTELERWSSLAAGFHAQQSQKAALDAHIQAEKARHEQELQGLRTRQSDISGTQTALPGLLEQQQKLNAQQSDMETRLQDLGNIDDERATATTRRADLLAEFNQNTIKKKEVEDRLSRLASATGSSCPLCGQPLNESHREKMRAELEEELTQLEKQLSAITAEGIIIKNDIAAFDKRISELKALRETFSTEQKAFGVLTARIEQAEAAIDQWKEKDHPRLDELETIIKEGSFAAQEREEIRILEEAIKAGGYDADAHEAARKAELAARDIETDFHALEKARAAVDGLTRELKTLEENCTAAEDEVRSQSAAFTDLQKKLSAQKETLPDLAVLETELDKLRSEENQLRQETGAAQQMVAVIETQRKRKVELDGQIEDLNRQITRLKLLETAFGKDGIPALLIEQALPEIESQANELLDRLSNGRMSLSFETEKEYKDKNRDDKKPTLDILISDSSGRREYELFSGGEAFRINFAIRLALSRVLAGRAGARLQTLVIDEGFGSQDADGLQRLIEAINLVKQDFAKILVITHLEELKDAFQSRIEVTKTESGSRVEVILS